MAKIKVVQPNLSIAFSRDFYPFRGLLIHPSNHTLWIMYGSPNDEATLQTISYDRRSTAVLLFYQDILNKQQRILKINL